MVIKIDEDISFKTLFEYYKDDHISDKFYLSVYNIEVDHDFIKSICNSLPYYCIEIHIDYNDTLIRFICMDKILLFCDYQDTNPLVLDLTNEMLIDDFKKKMEQGEYNVIKCKNLDNSNIYLNLTYFKFFYNNIFNTNKFNNILKKYNKFYFYIDEFKSCCIKRNSSDENKIQFVADYCIRLSSQSEFSSKNILDYYNEGILFTQHEEGYLDTSDNNIADADELNGNKLATCKKCGYIFLAAVSYLTDGDKKKYYTLNTTC